MSLNRWAYPVNNGAALIGGSHVQYVDYDRELFSQYIEKTYPASHMVVGAGQHIKKAYNLMGEPLGRRGAPTLPVIGLSRVPVIIRMDCCHFLALNMIGFTSHFALPIWRKLISGDLVSVSKTISS